MKTGKPNEATKAKVEWKAKRSQPKSEILEKPTLSGVLPETSQFLFGGGDLTNSLRDL